MKNFVLVLLLIFYSVNNIYSQSITPEYIRNMKVNDLSAAEIDKIKNEMDKKGLSIEGLENLALANGMPPSEFLILKQRLTSTDIQLINESNIETGTNVSGTPIEMDKVGQKSISKFEKKLFGSELFSNSNLNFDPSPNAATPSSYVLGPGDELQIHIYGAQELNSAQIVNKEGRISIPMVGELYLNGYNFEAAKNKIKMACSKIYGTLNSGGSQLSVNLLKLKSIQITIIGANKPGNYMVNSLSTVFNALHKADGPDENGSYRKIELIRNNKVYKVIDLYKFLTKGDLTDNVNLLENDIIRIPTYENRIQIDGNVKRPGIFELLPNENFNDLLVYSSGFDEAAHRSSIKIVQNTEKELKIVDISDNEYKTYHPKNGDVIKVSKILNRFENKVSVKGSVFRPDDYALSENMTLKDLILKADGPTEDAFYNRGIIIREKEDLTKEILNFNLKDILNDNKSIILKKNDEVLISSVFEFENNLMLSVNGEVKKPGKYPYIKGITLYDILIQAGGFNEKASRVVEISRKIIKDSVDKQHNTLAEIIKIEIDSSLMDNSKNLVLLQNDVVDVRKKPIFENYNAVSINGRIEYPGAYMLKNNNETVYDLIQRAGDLKSDANPNGIYVNRKVDRLISDKTEKIEVKIPINYQRILKNTKSRQNIYLRPEDEVFIPKIKKTVSIFGEVELKSEIPYSRKKTKFYLSAVGGLKDNASKKRIYVIYPNGVAKSTKSFLGFKKYPTVTPGSEIVVPKKDTENKDKMSVTEIAAITGVIGSLAGMTVTIINIFQK